MIDYTIIEKNNMFGTMKFCIKNFPQDFSNIEFHTLYQACDMGNSDIEIIYLLKDNPYVNKADLYNITLNEPCITHRLLRENFFDQDKTLLESYYDRAFKFYVKFGSKFPKKRNHYLKMFIRKILKPRININIDTLDKYYFNLPKELQEYFFKTLFYSDSTENSLTIISKFLREYKSLTYFFRHCKPKLDWDKLIHSISEETFYRIISITNRMKAYKNIQHSYEEMKKLHQTKMVPEAYSKIITDYLKSYTDKTIMSQLVHPRPFTVDFDRDYRVQRPRNYNVIHTEY